MFKSPRLKKIILAVSVVLLCLAGFFLWWRDWRVASMPNSEGSLNVEEFLAEYEGGEPNAFDEYRKTLPVFIKLHANASYANVNYNMAYDDWENVDELTAAYVAEMMPQLQPFAAGSHLEKGFEIDPHRMNFETLLEVTQESREYARIMLLETSRLRAEGNWDEVWSRYGELLRVSGHIRNGCLISLLVGNAIYKVWYPQFALFLTDKTLTVEELKRFRGELILIHQQFPPPSVAMKFEYMGMRNSLIPMVEQHPWLNKLTREDEVFDRILSLYYEHWLKYVDRPAWDIPPLVEHSCQSSTVANWINPQLSQCRWHHFDTGAESDALVKAFHKVSYTQKYLRAFMPALQAVLESQKKDRLYQQMSLVQLGMHIYYREQGDFPKQLEDLVPEYIPELPRTLDETGDVLLYERTAEGVLIHTTDMKYAFNVYVPGASIENLYTPE
ncbi:MAG: hypothetical protein R3C11_10090 [Planctomycetaceae bacterium]